MSWFVQESMFLAAKKLCNVSKKGYGCKWKLETVQHSRNYNIGTTLVLLFYISKSQQGVQQ